MSEARLITIFKEWLELKYDGSEEARKALYSSDAQSINDEWECFLAGQGLYLLSEGQ